MIEFNYLFREVIQFLRNEEVSFVPKQQILITAVYHFLKHPKLEIMVL
jgi:hypothetical protein